LIGVEEWKCFGAVACMAVKIPLQIGVKRVLVVHLIDWRRGGIACGDLAFGWRGCSKDYGVFATSQAGDDRMEEGICL
jgi:hypothetical protein